MKLKMMIVLGALALGACNTTTADYRAGDVVQTADGRTKKLTAAEAKNMRCQDKQRKNANVATAASVVGAGASVAGTAAAYRGYGWGYGWGYGYHPGAAVAGAAVSGVSNVVAQQATNNQIEAAMGNC